MSDAQTIRNLRSALVNGERFAMVAGNILQFLPQTDDTGYFSIGNATYAMDFKWFGSASSKYVLFDVGNSLLKLEDIDMLLGDDDKLTFGNGSDVQVEWDATRLTSGPASGFWADCPSKLDPDWMSKAMIIEHQFADCGEATDWGWNVGTNTNGSVATGDAVTANQPGVGGFLLLSTDGSLQYDYVTIKLSGYGGAGCPVKITENSGLKMWFEVKVIPGSITDQYFMVGLGSANADDVQVDATGAENIQDGIYFRTLLDAETEIDTCTNQNTTETEVAAAAGTAAANTALKLGMYFDGVTTLTFYINGTALGDVLTIGDGGDVPNDVGLTPFISYKDATAAGTPSTFCVEYMKLVQLKA